MGKQSKKKKKETGQKHSLKGSDLPQGPQNMGLYMERDICIKDVKIRGRKCHLQVKRSENQYEVFGQIFFRGFQVPFWAKWRKQ